MKRSDFLKKLGIGLGVAVVAPSVVLAEKENITLPDLPKGTLLHEDGTPLVTKVGYPRQWSSWYERYNIYPDTYIALTRKYGW